MSTALAFQATRSGCSWLAVGCSFTLLTAAAAADWPQYRGPSHNGTSSDRITKDWTGNVTNALWLVPVTNGLCSFAVRPPRVFTQIRRTINSQPKEVCVALSITNGAELWATTIDNAFYSGGVGYDDGPRSTPTVDGDSVYVLSSYINLYRLNVTNGAVIWHKDLRAIYGGNVIEWQNAASPVLENGLIFVNANCGNSTLMGLRTSDGEPAWRSHNEAMTHSTPALATIHGTRQVIFATQSGLVSLNPQSGSLLWRHNYPFAYSTSLAVSPVVYQDMIFLSGAHSYGMGSVVVRASLTNSTWSTTQLWWTNFPASHWMTPVVHEGFLYGQMGTGAFDSHLAQLHCVDMRTGAIQWTADGFGRGGTLLVDKKLVAITEVGDLVLAEPNPNAYVELGRFNAIPDYHGDFNKCWNMPAVGDGRVYVRSTSFGACFDLSVPELKLDPPQLVAGNKAVITARTANGAEIVSDRLAAIELRSSTNLSSTPDVWAKVTNTLTLTNGTLLVTNINLGSSTQRFFILSEPH